MTPSPDPETRPDPAPKPIRNPTGAGVFIAVLSIGGTIGGGFLGQPSIGLLAGFGTGVGIAIVLWLRERR